MRSKSEPALVPLPAPARDPELESSERVSHPASAGAPSGTRDVDAAARTELPAAWLERLLTLSSRLLASRDADEEAVTRAVVDAVAEIVPHHAVGVCLVTSAGAACEVRASSLRDDGASPRLAGLDPTRLFAARAFERVVPVDGSPGTTLHLAWDGASDAGAGDAAQASLLAHAASLLSHGLDRARRNEASARDASALHALRGQMVQAEKLASLGQIAAGVVHELNNPLTSIVAYTDFLIRRVAARPDADADELDRLRRIAESAGRMLRFTRDLVSYARPSSEIPVPVSVHVVIEQALAFCEHILNQAGAVIDRRFAASLPAVRGKPEQLAQVFVNLITNASHALPPRGGVLVFRTERHGDAVKITVHDNGHGIVAEHLDRVFHPFFTTKGAGLGTGLGLTIVKSIVDAHDGTIAVVSDGQQGTAFEITLPAATR